MQRIYDGKSGLVLNLDLVINKNIKFYFNYLGEFVVKDANQAFRRALIDLVMTNLSITLRMQKTGLANFKIIPSQLYEYDKKDNALIFLTPYSEFVNAILETLFEAKLEKGLPVSHNQSIKDYNGVHVFFYKKGKIALIDPIIHASDLSHEWGSYAKQSAQMLVRFFEYYLKQEYKIDKIKQARFYQASYSSDDVAFEAESRIELYVSVDQSRIIKAALLANYPTIPIYNIKCLTKVTQTSEGSLVLSDGPCSDVQKINEYLEDGNFVAERVLEAVIEDFKKRDEPFPIGIAYRTCNYLTVRSPEIGVHGKFEVFINPDYVEKAKKVINCYFPDLTIKRSHNLKPIFFRPAAKISEKINPCDSGQEIKIRPLR